MDFGTIITILIIVGSFIYSAVQNLRTYREQQPGQEPREEVPDPFPTDPFAEAQRPSSQPAEAESQTAPAESAEPQQPAPPYDPGGPYPRELLNRETTRTTQQETPDAETQPYQRRHNQAYKRTEETPYEQRSAASYQRKQKQAHRRKKASNKKRLRAQQHLRKSQLQQFDPVQAVIYSEVLNRPKYLDDPSSKPRF